MYRRLSILLATVAMLASCSKEPAEAPDGDADQNRNTLSFTYRSYTGAGTYAEIALDPEKVVRDLDIWMFSGGAFVKQLASGTDYTSTPNGTMTTVTMTRTFVDTYVGQTLVFYFVGNNAASTGGTHISTFSGTETDFTDLLTSTLNNGTQPGYAENITIAPGTGGVLMTGKSEPIMLLDKHSVTIEFKRRVARFDIVNPKPTQYRITGIYISGAKEQGVMFATGSGLAPVATRNLDKITGPVSGDYDGTLAKCVFYLYPTDLLTTTISMEVQYIGEADGEKKMFTVADTGVSIVANKRYTLMLDPSNLTFTVGGGDYDEDEDDEIPMG